MRHWGKMLIANAYGCNRQLVSCPKNIEMFSNNLVKSIDMVPYGKAQLAHFGSGNKSGWTLVQLIETSNITGHFCDDDGSAYIDCFSCKDYDVETVRESILYWFKPTMLDIKVINRDSRYKME